MTNKQKLEAIEMKELLIVECGSRCQVCGELVNSQTAQLAHRIPKTKFYLKKYGDKVINSPLNLVVVCGLKCNAAVLCNPATRPIEAEELIEKIKRS